MSRFSAVRWLFLSFHTSCSSRGGCRCSPDRAKNRQGQRYFSSPVSSPPSFGTLISDTTNPGAPHEPQGPPRRYLRHVCLRRACLRVSACAAPACAMPCHHRLIARYLSAPSQSSHPWRTLSLLPRPMLRRKRLPKLSQLPRSAPSLRHNMAAPVAPHAVPGLPLPAPAPVPAPAPHRPFHTPTYTTSAKVNLIIVPPKVEPTACCLVRSHAPCTA